MEIEILVSVCLLLTGIAVLVVIHICVASRPSGGTEVPAAFARRDRGTPSMSQDEIKNLPCFDYCDRVDDGDGKKEGSSSSITTFECVVCLDGFKDGQKCRLLPKCSHSFHVECIDSWLTKTGACPICRTDAVISGNGEEKTAMVSHEVLANRISQTEENLSLS